jgi:SAM-dependent methyltransferase
MNSDFLAYITCPNCRGNDLVAEADPPRELTCTRCGFSVPIVDGVPRLIGPTDSYAASFGRQWNRYDVTRPDEDEATFQVKTGVAARDLADKLVLDAGCGGGRYARLLGSHDARVIAVDLSSAVVKATSLCAPFPDVLVLQADLLDLPLSEGVFDLVYSIGVLHHTPDPRRAFHQIARRVKPGGRLAVWLYRRNSPPQEWLNNGLRAVTTRMPAQVLEPVCVGLGAVGGIPLLNRTLNKLANFSNHADWTLRVCDNFDWYAPRFQSHHSLGELKRWFAEEGFTELVELFPAKNGALYNWAYDHNLIIGSGVNVAGRKA